MSFSYPSKLRSIIHIGWSFRQWTAFENGVCYALSGRCMLILELRYNLVINLDVLRPQYFLNLNSICKTS